MIEMISPICTSNNCAIIKHAICRFLLVQKAPNCTLYKQATAYLAETGSQDQRQEKVQDRYKRAHQHIEVAAPVYGVGILN